MPTVKAPTRGKRPSRRDSDSVPPILPSFRPPQLATLERNIPKGDWLFEMKLDGYRMQASIAGDQVRLYTRNGHDWTRQFGYVVPALSRLTKGTALIDGELCAIDEQGRSNFTLLKNSLDGSKPVLFYAFDLLELNGEDIARLPQVERKRRLEALLRNVPEADPVAYSDHIVGSGEDVFRAMCEGGYEGMIAKSPTARYYGGDRSSTWLKIKCVKRQEFVVIGWRPPEYGVDNVRGLFLATYEDGRLVYRGGVGTGFTDRLRREVWEVLQLIRTEERPPVVGMPKTEARAARWVEPRLLAEVEFTEVTPDGLIRHPSFKGLREDKDAREVHLEEAQNAQSA
jgi:DNA ligase D-like protein (predicted ligase)